MYVQKRYLITDVREVVEDEVISVEGGKNLYAKKGEVVATNYLGDMFVATKKYLERNYVVLNSLVG
ncbi:MAG: hypothetical protein LPK00_13145 [Bacillaceae bacterium]|nr:hypothetical protein [Bacillaceae bacterium]